MTARVARPTMGRMTYRILGKRVLVQRVETEERMGEAPHVIIPEEVREGLTANQAEIVSVGSGCQPHLKAGDWVLLRAWSKSDAPPELGDGLWLVPEDAVLGILS